MNTIALDEAYLKWADELVGYATVLVGPSDADDVVADTFASMLQRSRAGTLSPAWESVIEPRTYLYKCVFNTARMLHRSSGRRRRRDDRVAKWAPPSGQFVASSGASTHVVSAVRELSIQQRAVVFLTYWEDQSVAQVSEILGCSAGSVKRQLARARARLRITIDRKDLS